MTLRQGVVGSFQGGRVLLARGTWLACVALCSVTTFVHAAGSAHRTLDGTSPPSGRQQAAHDDEALRAQHEAVVGLIGARGLICSGVLVRPYAILTAKHCTSARVVAFGTDTAEPALIRRVVGWRTPPNSALDLAVGIIDAVPLRPYPFRTSSASPPRAVRVVGYGATDFADASSGGRRTYFDARVRGWGCDSNAAMTTGCIPEFELFIPRAAGADSCAGDSGGPVLERDGVGWQVLAITSRSVTRAVLPCGDGGVYVRTDVVAAWLERELTEGQHERQAH